MEQIIELKPIKESQEDYDEIEKKLKELFKQEIYFPILKYLNINKKTLKNSKDSLIDDFFDGKIYYEDGKFKGKFDATSSKTLRDIGAEWDSDTRAFELSESQIPMDIRAALMASNRNYANRVYEMDKTLSLMNPENIAEKIYIMPQFVSVLKKVDGDFKKTVENLLVNPQLSPEGREKVASEWQNNMKLWIRNFTSEHIQELRGKIQENAFAGKRREAMIGTIQESYGVSQNKAKFLARQETNLLMSKYKETKYTGAGVMEYKWACVRMPHQPSPRTPYKTGEVRYSHGILDGKIFRWDDPPITTAPGEKVRRNNPGCDYNCRCFPIPVVRFNSANSPFRSAA